MDYVEYIRKKIGNDAIFLPASGCAIIQNNKILLQKRTDNKKWGLHGGYMNLGETSLETLNRELKEELNIIPLNPELINVYSGEDLHVFYPNNDEVYSVVTLYLVEEFEGSLKPFEKEVEEVEWFEFDNLPDDINECDIKMIGDVILFYKNTKK